MQLFVNSVVFAAFTGFLVDYWLKRATVKDPVALIVAVAAAVVVGVLVALTSLAVF